MKNFKKLVYLFVIISNAAFGLGLGFASVDNENSLEIQRTNFSVAHIRAFNYEGLGYGVAYAHAQDNYGSSYIQVVTFDDLAPVAEGLLTFGQSSDPASPYAYDQLQWFSRGQWIKQPFHPEDVQAQRVGEVLRLKIR